MMSLRYLDTFSNYDDRKRSQLLVHELNKKYSAFMIAIISWAVRPTQIELENLLLNQEALNLLLYHEAANTKEEPYFLKLRR